MIDPEKVLYGSEKKRIALENFMHNYKFGVSRQHRIYRNLSYMHSTYKVLYSIHSAVSLFILPQAALQSVLAEPAEDSVLFTCFVCEIA